MDGKTIAHDISQIHLGDMRIDNMVIFWGHLRRPRTGQMTLVDLIDGFRMGMPAGMDIRRLTPLYRMRSPNFTTTEQDVIRWFNYALDRMCYLSNDLLYALEHPAPRMEKFRISDEVIITFTMIRQIRDLEIEASLYAIPGA